MSMGAVSMSHYITITYDNVTLNDAHVIFRAQYLSAVCGQLPNSCIHFTLLLDYC